ncbi:transmembrane protein 176B-like isoform X2 [Cebidichthys violaceus]|uniref:transmembrane protein 176B-like isoform X2 n=1 Tax=Cebidichthys violaceus TaxID=271503 RepID=UPI0035CB7842
MFTSRHVSCSVSGSCLCRRSLLLHTPEAGRMSVTMSKAEGVTVFTMTSDPQSVLPPLCQIFKGLCYSPVCCSVSQNLRRVQRNSQSVLGALHIMVGLLNIGLGVILVCSQGGSWWQMDSTAFPFWIGGLIIMFGIVGILSEKYPSPCLVIVNVILNLAGVALSIAAIVLYSINIAHIGLWWMCRNDDYYNSGYRHTTTTTESPGEKYITEKCLEAKELALMILRSVNALLIVLSALELCLVISSAVLGIKALRSSEKGEKEMGDPEVYKPLLEEVTSHSTA